LRQYFVLFIMIDKAINAAITATAYRVYVNSTTARHVLETDSNIPIINVFSKTLFSFEEIYTHRNLFICSAVLANKHLEVQVEC